MERLAITVRGTVQGVGFRPFVYNLASRLRLGGFVRNQTGSVLIEVQGEPPSLAQFLTDLAQHPPPLAQIQQISCEPQLPRAEGRFRIEPSQADPSASVFISPDVAVCQGCLRELFDPADRRYGYPFLNCTNCGPRLTVVTGFPYDRERTTLAGFPLCPACRAEYEDPGNRRFHAQPTACADCGPRLRPAGVVRAGAPSGEDRRSEGPGRLSPRLRRTQPGGRGRAAAAEAARREAVCHHGAGHRGGARAGRGRSGGARLAPVAARPHRAAPQRSHRR